MTDNPPAGIHPLRQRLAAEIEDAATTFYGPSEAPLAEVVAGAANRALEHVADWLRDEATISPGAVAERQFVLNRLADAIYPKEAHE